MKIITVENIVRTFSFDVLTGQDQLHRVLKKSKVRRPGLEFMDKFDFIATEHVQILGKNEINYLHTLSDQECKLRIGNIVQYNPPCIIITSNQDEPLGLIQYCVEKKIPVLRTHDSTSEVSAKLDAYVVKAMAEEIAIHGVCVNVAGIGILLRGKSGVGKSETAHILIGRGHRLVADDIVVLKKLSPQTLLGSHNEKNKEFLALRSIGLLNVVRLYGRAAFQDETRIALDIELTKWEDNTLNNELELATKFTEYMGVQIPHIQIQLQPGRDVAGLIEAAANNWYLKQQGYSAAEEFVKRLEQDFDQ
ncbi:HPr(Ser) kinase/phosphatase [Psychrobacillus lasiicapitis]|uniref:HPr kinase/phosphorylase n=1 Tax=Psychrobacillus lasiicapitis TaxID=1636719 RepID=A0A544TET4_9BACI|nr:HPr(Ser) kinase/phosphatase [Psychrobacillus lasiicapitis]TQR15968.1 HPr kinase/phosphorylase [Psychrobacillus lasiicapitis]GGA16565.1 HPr kinase/phosphorylase [Psychrobacillus lasiicapitis]